MVKTAICEPNDHFSTPLPKRRLILALILVLILRFICVRVIPIDPRIEPQFNILRFIFRNQFFEFFQSHRIASLLKFFISFYPLG